MKDTIYRFAFFSPYQREAMAEYLERMAARGWLLDKTGNSVWRFRRVEPKRLTFEVVFFPDASGFDPGPTPELETMAEYCARDGWTLLAQWGQAQVFMNDQENPTPIETDPVIQMRTVHRAMKRSILPAWLVLLAVTLLQLGMKLTLLRRDLIGTLSDPTDLWMFPFWLLLMAAQLWELGYYFLWLHRARRAAEDGVFLPSGKTRWGSWLMLGAALLLLLRVSVGSRYMSRYMALWTVCYLGIIFLVSRIRDGMKAKGASRGLNRTVTIGATVVLTVGFFIGVAALTIRFGWARQEAPERYTYQGFTFSVWHDPLPLTVADLTGPNEARYSTTAERDETFLLAQTRYQQDRLLSEPKVTPAPGELDYTVVEVKAPFLYGLCREELLEELVFDEECRAQAIDPGPWGAEEAYQQYWGEEPMGGYLLCCPGRLVKIRIYNIEMTEERMGIVGEKLLSSIRRHTASHYKY